MSYAPNMRESSRKREPANAQIGMRWRASERARIEEASRLSGEPLSTIVVNGALREADRLIRIAEREKAGKAEEPAGDSGGA